MKIITLFYLTLAMTELNKLHPTDVKLSPNCKDKQFENFSSQVLHDTVMLPSVSSGKQEDF